VKREAGRDSEGRTGAPDWGPGGLHRIAAGESGWSALTTTLTCLPRAPPS